MSRRILNTTFQSQEWDNPNFSFAPNGVTIIYSGSTSGETGTYLPTSITYTSVNQTSFDALVVGIDDFSLVVPFGLTSLRNRFRNETTFNDDISHYDVSGVTDGANTFRDASSFNQPLGFWDTSAFTNMSSMFRSATIYNQDLSTWCVSQFSSKPAGFDTGTPFWSEPKPNWGVPCV